MGLSDGPLFMQIKSNKLCYMLEQPKSLKSYYNNIYNNGKSLRLVNQQETNYLGSSETTCKATSNSLYNFNLNKIFPSHINISQVPSYFLEWFIGFVEGDGSFLVSKNRLFFILNQKDIRTLYRIRSILGFGKVSSYNGIGRYIISDMKGIERLIFIFNGNLLLTKTNERFNNWLNKYNELAFKKSLPLINLIQSRLNQQLKEKLFIDLFSTGWLSGFISAEGCFNAFYQSNKNYLSGYRFRSRFIVDQKDEEELLQLLYLNFKSGYIHNRIALNQRFIIDSFIGCLAVINYLNKFPQFHFIKHLAYVKWKKYVLIITNKKLMNQLKLNKEQNKIPLLNIEKLKRLAKSINNLEEEIELNEVEDIVQS